MNIPQDQLGDHPAHAEQPETELPNGQNGNGLAHQQIEEKLKEGCESRLSDEHYEAVMMAFRDGRVVPFLGAGVNLCGRPKEFRYQPSQFEYLPNGGELAEKKGRRRSGVKPRAEQAAQPQPSQHSVLPVHILLDRTRV